MNARGYTLVELMVAVTLAALLSLGVIGLYAQQSGVLRLEERRQQSLQEGAYLYDLLAALLRQAEDGSVRLRTVPAIPPDPAAPEGEDDALVVDLRLPAGVPAWPNVDGQRPAVRLAWRRGQDALWIATAADPAALDTAPLRPYGGPGTAAILDLDLWPLDGRLNLQPAPDAPAPGGYLLAVLTRSGDARGQQAVSGVVAPRN